MITETTSPNGKEQAALCSSALLDSVYDVLVKIGGADEYMRGSFVQNHQDEKYPCTEWRFCGHLGFGGKYRSKTNKVDCYREDETPKRLAIIGELNAALAKLSNIKAEPPPVSGGEAQRKTLK